MPVSTHGAGSDVSEPSRSRLNCMKTRFQISSTVGSSIFTMDLRARSARPCVAHLPKVILHPKRHDPLGGQVVEPEPSRLLVRRHPKVVVASKVGHVQPFGGDAVHACQQLPRPLDGLLLEVVAKGPVAQHLEEGVVVDVLADVVQVVVLAARADALLGVGRAAQLGHGRVGVRLAQEDGLELVHPRVDEKQRRVVVRHHRRRRPVRVAGRRLKVRDERVAHLRRRGETTRRRLRTYRR
eukprot:6203228-Pleurochrysis_carterae.AAC.3